MSSFGDISINSAMSDNKFKQFRDQNVEVTETDAVPSAEKRSSQIIGEENYNDPNFTIAKIEGTNE